MNDRSNPSEQSTSYELLTLAQEAGRVGLFEWLIAAGTMRASPRFLSLHGLMEFDSHHESWIRSIHREDQVRVRDLIETSFSKQTRELQTEYRVHETPTSALRWLEMRAIVLYADDRTTLRLVGVCVEITERKRAIVELRAFTESLEDAVKERTRELEAQNEARLKAEESLRQAQKMEAVGQLTGGIAHDFNNLLTIVTGGLDIIGRQIPELPPMPAVTRIQRARDMAMQGAQRAATLTSRLLAFSRQQALSPRAIDANKLVAGTSELLRRTLGETVSLETVLVAGLWRVFADPNQFENALVNLVINARDAMPNGGKVIVETSNCYLDQAYVDAISEPIEAGPYVMTAVADTGVGMDQKTRERAFDPFFTTKGVGKGTGLGLSQVYGFVRQTGGHVKICSELGQGTTVKIYLPRYTGEESVDEEHHVSAPMVAAIDNETILVAEDDETLRSYTSEILRELGYIVLEAHDGPSALGVLEKRAVDLLFTDVVMPGGMNGRQLANEAVRRRPGLKVLYTSGYSRNAIVHDGRLDPGIQLISKPFSFAELSVKVRSILDQ